TNVRTNAILPAKWPEFDLDRALWTVPLVNLKDREHRKESFEIPLSPRAVEIVKEMEKARVSTFVFPGQRKSHRRDSRNPNLRQLHQVCVRCRTFRPSSSGVSKPIALRSSQWAGFSSIAIR